MQAHPESSAKEMSAAGDKPEYTLVQRTVYRATRLRNAVEAEGKTGVRVGLAGVFLVGVLIATAFISSAAEGGLLIVAAGVIGGYMALNIGANDVANNMGPAVGSGAITMVGALVIAAVFETAGAVVAGGDVVSTIAKGIIDPAAIDDTGIFVTAMMAALLAAALWLNLATYVGAPVSTTHSIVGGVMGAGIAAVGISAVQWGTMAKIAASWVISPVMGGIIAALFLTLVRRTILFKPDRIAAARRWVPILVAIMCSAFAMYLMVKGLKRVWKFDSELVAAAGVAVFFLSWFAVRPTIARKSVGLENRKKAVHGLFSAPLIAAAALLSFAHGANDVANAVGPLAAIVSALSSGGMAAKVGIPLWVLVVGAIGISVGLALFGPKLIRTVGEKITKVNPIRAFCVALSAAITVLIASALGLPVSSTHIAVGGVFGVGFLREVLHYRIMAAREASQEVAKNQKKKKKKRKLVRRKHVTTIIAAWLITVPLAAFLAAFLFFVLHYGKEMPF